MTSLFARQHASCVVAYSDLEIWRGERCLLSHAQFTQTHPLVHVKGVNGSGKTTLLKVLAGLSTAETGSVEWRRDGSLISPTAGGLLAYAGHLEGLNPALSVLENVQWGAGLQRDLSSAHIESAFASLSLSALLPRLARQLSAGQRRRVALLRSVLTQSPVLVWDEPYANLDEAGVEFVDALLRQHLEVGGCALVSAHRVPSVASSQRQTLVLHS
ncbi:MAG: heme ABC exporter ATP-binding protein CcmA [Pseudomonadota bacterium]